MRLNKKAVFFSTDALIALTIVLFVVLLAIPLVSQRQTTTEIPGDILTTLSALKMSEIVSSGLYPASIPVEDFDLEKTVLEQMGEFYATNITRARLLAQNVLSGLDINENIGIWYGNSLIYSNNDSPIESAENIETRRQVISGIENEAGSNSSATGYSARSFLTTTQRTEYYYFGGYVGDGNLSATIEYDGTISSAEIEISINNDFDLKINGQPAGSYEKSVDEFTPKRYILEPQYVSLFNSGVNEVTFEGKSLAITGGFIKITYDSNAEIKQQTKKYLSGIDGVINLYDGFYVPGELETLDIYLHLNSSILKVFLNVGNVTVYNSTTNDEQTIIITNSVLQNLLDYSEISQETIPLRIGLENVSFVVNASLDVVSIIDMSKYMRCSIFQYGPNKNQCESNGGVWMLPANFSRDGNILLINEILSLSSGRIGLIGMDASENPVLYHTLSDDSNSLLNTASELDEEGNYNANNLRLCAGVTNAIDEYVANSNDETIKIIITMLAGQISNPPCNIATVDLNSDGNVDSLDDAIQAACDAYEEHNITVHTIGYGEVVDTDTLERMAACGNGEFHHQPNVSQLISTYQDIVNEIKVQYQLQSVETIENISSKMFSDSYIEYSYDSQDPVLGLIITAEKTFDNLLSANFTVPLDSNIIRATGISYSGPRWTNYLEINNSPVYNLTNYGNNYIPLGDPYAIDIPPSLIQEENNVKITTGISPYNTTSGSLSNKIIYTIARNITGYSPIAASAQGCLWNIQFEDYSNITNAKIPSSYTGSENCFYQENKCGSSYYNINDAFQASTFDLLENLDFDLDCKLDAKFSESNLNISSGQIEGIPFTWQTEVQIRTWY